MPLLTRAMPLFVTQATPLLARAMPLFGTRAMPLLTLVENGSHGSHGWAFVLML